MAKKIIKNNYKDSVFRMLFSEKEDLLLLYNAVNGTYYTDADNLEITTLDNAIYMNMKNDVSFIFRFYLNLYEHQSTYNPNMPLRDLFYISRQYERYLTDCTLYSSSPVKLPTPRFVVFYNGSRTQPERTILKLSDLYMNKTDSPELELKVLVLNINCGMNEDILNTCNTLRDYCTYVDLVRTYAKKVPIEEAVNKAVSKCINDGILADFLIKQKAEAIAVSIFEYNEEEELRKIRESEYRFGEESGMAQGLKQGLSFSLLNILKRYGNIPSCLQESIYGQSDADTLKSWLDAALQVSSISEFRKMCKL